MSCCDYDEHDDYNVNHRDRSEVADGPEVIEHPPASEETMMVAMAEREAADKRYQEWERQEIEKNLKNFDTFKKVLCPILVIIAVLVYYFSFFRN